MYISLSNTSSNGNYRKSNDNFITANGNLKNLQNKNPVKRQRFDFHLQMVMFGYYITYKNSS
jgi:hypothetical protein